MIPGKLLSLSEEMTFKRFKLFFIVLLSTCVLNHCLGTASADEKQSLHDAGKDFSAKEATNGANHNIAKRVVNPSSWQNQNSGSGGQNRDANKSNRQQATSHSELYLSSHHDDDEFEEYEGISAESTKPRREKLNRESASTQVQAAKYDPSRGVECPDPDATGLYAYPPDCRFFVTCWKGRAFVQPCAPGTLFSPEGLECDFPHKVKCYGGEIADFEAAENGPVDRDDGREPLSTPGPARYENPNEPTCLPNLNGMIPHPSDCKKFVQCVNGKAYILECGQNTVFNPITHLCDWPQNVNGCEDHAAHSNNNNNNKEEFGEYTDPQRPPKEQDYSTLIDVRVGEQSQNSPRSAKKIECPRDFSGLLPHPDTCKKFLQCANGVTYIMDCGPGTAFNPLTSVCDWPHNVHGCSNEDSPSRQSSNIGRVPSKPSGSASNQQSYLNRPNERTTVNPTKNQNWNNNGYQGTYANSANRGQNQNTYGSSDLNRPSQSQGYEGNYGVTSQSNYNEDSHVESASPTTQFQSPPLNQPPVSWSNPGHHRAHSYHNYRPQSHHHEYNHGFGSPQTGNQQGHFPHNNHQSSQPSYDFNGHGYPYGSQQSSYNQPSASIPGESPNSSEEDFQNNSNQGHAWAEPSINGRPTSTAESPVMHIPSDRRNYGRTSDSIGSESESRWSVPEKPQPRPGVFQPSTWRGLGPGFEQRPSYQSRSNVEEEGLNKVLTSNKPFVRPESPNIRDSDNGEWIPSLNMFVTVNNSTFDPKSLNNNTKNGTRGHYITQEIIINQGHSKMRQQNSTYLGNLPKKITPSESDHVMRIPSNGGTTTYKPDMIFPDQLNVTVVTHVNVQSNKKDDSESSDSNEKNKEFEYRTPNNQKLPTVSIELEEDWNSSLPMIERRPNSWSQTTVSKKSRDNIEPDEVSSENEDDFAVEVETSNNNKPWKPQLVFPNRGKTNKKDDKSAVMKVNNRNKIHPFSSDVEEAPFLDEQPPFPVHYNQIKSSLNQLSDPKIGQHAPLSGQIVRLRGGSSPSEGFVEVQGNQPGWGQVCDVKDGWTIEEANVVCKQLGYGRGAASAWQGRPRTSDVPKWIAANTVSCNGNETKFQTCKFTHRPQCMVERNAIAVRCLPHRTAHCRDDELAHDGQCYHVAEPNKALNHAEAHDYCHNRGSRLIDLIDQRENDFISEILIQNMPQVDTIMTSGMGFTTYNMTIWMWEDSSVAKFKFTKWWPGWTGEKKTAPFAGSRPVCILMTRKYPCHDRPETSCKSDYFFWDVEDCAASNKGHSLICERPYDDIGCVYGNGNQYYGNASIAASGRTCLSWSDSEVARSLMSKVPSREDREKLQDHNYCRNPNPNKESRPWCFTGPRGEYDYCDIPYCGKILSKKSHLTGKCKPKHFECLPGECIPSPWVCDGQEDCTNGADERKCSSHLSFFKKYPKQKLDGFEVEKWLNTPAKSCSLRCKEADFTCRSFTHRTKDNTCFLSDRNIGMTGALEENNEFDYYEMRDRSVDCEDMFVCKNQKCINKTLICDGKNDCNDRSDEKICTVENLGYEIRLAGANSTNEGRVEVKILGNWGQVCDDSFDLVDAGVICRELGFQYGALEVKPGGFYGNLDPPDVFMVDQLKCRGNESTIRECDFDGWGKHNCEPEEAVGIVCKSELDACKNDMWKCMNAPMCIPTHFICDVVADCPDESDESPLLCDVPFDLRLANGSSPMEGRVEIRHHGIWGTVCDDDFTNAAANVICRSLGYGGPAIMKKGGVFGPGEGPIWLDEVSCIGNETKLNECEHASWGRHNCEHIEDVGVICSAGPVPTEYEESGEKGRASSESEESAVNVDELLPSQCGKRLEDFDEDDELVYERVVRGSIAPRGSYPWQASLRVRGHSRSSHWCGAVVLSPLHILTAAHCLDGYNKGTYIVRAGDYNTEVDEGTEVEANIEDYYVHEDFRKGHRYNNDIAVVLLKGRGIPLGRNVMPICLPHENIEYPAGLNCTISGFGSIESGNTAHSRKMRFGWVPLLDQKVCKEDRVYGKLSLTDGMICAGHLNGGPDTCDGDSGGPLACIHNGAFTLYGLTSWGQHCGEANKPGVYVRIAHYRKWIDEKIRESLGR